MFKPANALDGNDDDVIDNGDAICNNDVLRNRDCEMESMKWDDVVLVMIQ